VRVRSIAAGLVVAALVAAGYVAGTSRGHEDLAAAAPRHGAASLWSTYRTVLRHARYVDLTHKITPGMPGWKGFGPS
jgi:hypothetical protein